MPLCNRAGIGQLAYCPLAQGVLSGKYRPGTPPPPDSRAVDDRQNAFIKQMVQDRVLLEKAQKLAPIAEAHRCTLPQLALAWILRRQEVTSCITGATRPEHIAENAKASGIKLGQDTVRQMEQIVA